MTTSPSGPDAWTLFAAAEGTGRAQEAVRLGFGMWSGWWPWPWAWLGGFRQAVRCPPPSKPQPGRTAEPGWRAGAAAPLPPTPTTWGSSTPPAAACWPGWATGWTTTRLTGAEGEEENPDSNGQVVVYDSVRDGDSDIFWQPVGGGPEHRLALPGAQRNPNISGHVVAFESFETDSGGPNWDLMLYDLASDTVYRLTRAVVDETLNDVWLAADGLVRVADTAQDGPDANVDAVSFELPAADTTPPALRLPADITSQATGASQATVTYTATATDLMDGPVPVSCAPASGSAFPAGTTVVNCSATDAHNNTATGSFTVSVVYGWGFFPPVDNLPTVNTVKAGSAIPVKFRLSGNQGLNIFKSGSPASASYTCSGTAPTDAIEQTGTASASGLSYDATTDQYTYVWKTDKAWAGSCRALVVKLADNTTKTANFQFTK